ncbi:MAG: hypothetical protein Q9163_000265 [Psora crenata]
MKLLEIERKFTWKPASLEILMSNGGRPSFTSRPTIQTMRFRDTYYDLEDKLSNQGLWVRKRLHYNHPPPPRQVQNPTTTGVWEAKQSMPGSSFARSTYDETQDLGRILQMVRNRVPGCPGPEDSFGLEELCRFETHRRSFLADGKFTVVLDQTDFGHSVGEVELLAQDADKAHADIDVFLARYAWLFDCSKPKGKLTAYFEKYPQSRNAASQ